MNLMCILKFNILKLCNLAVAKFKRIRIEKDAEKVRIQNRIDDR